MQTLSEVVRALRTEVAAALADGGALPDGCRVEADRVVATIGFAIVSGPDETSSRRPPRFVVAGESVAAHTLRVEFAVRDCGGGASSISNGRAVEEPAPVAMAAVDAGRAVEILSSVFGAPGFDSSARASVFRETLVALEPGDARRLIESLAEGAPTGDRGFDHARHLVRRVIASGPASVDVGVAALRGLFRDHDASGILSLVGERWRTQHDWLE